MQAGTDLVFKLMTNPRQQLHLKLTSIRLLKHNVGQASLIQTAALVQCHVKRRREHLSRRMLGI